MGAPINDLWQKYLADRVAGIPLVTTGSVSGTADVNVVNTPAVTISGTPNVAVTNTPSVTVSGTPNVAVTNTPNVAVTNTPSVTISGTVPVSQLAWTPNSQTALSNTKTQIKGSAGTFGGYMIYNPNATVAHIQVFDVALGSITVGSTAPTYVLSIPATSGANLELADGVTHATAICVAATTTPTGSTAPSSALVCAFFYR